MKHLRGRGRNTWGTRRLGVIGLVCFAGCATSPFHRAGDADDVAAALARAHPSAPSGRAVAYLALAGAAGPRLAAYDLAGAKLLWTQPAEVTMRVEAGPDVIVHGAKGGGPNGLLVGRAARDGSVLWQRPTGASERVFGYAIGGDAVFVVVEQQPPGGKATGALYALDARTGAQRWHRDLPSGRVAAPAARDGLVAVPLDSQYVLLYDGASGADLAQVLSTEEAATFVRALPEGWFYGSHGVFLMNRATARGSRRTPSYFTARLPAFVRPVYWYDLYRPEQAEYSAIDRNRILWRVTVDGDRAQFKDGLAFVHDYRFFFAFDAGSGALRWAHSEPSDAVASLDTGRAILYVTAEGGFGALDPATGTKVYDAHLPPDMVRGATFDAEGFAPASATASAKPADLPGTLASIIDDPDQRFPALKLFAVEELGRQPGREVTQKLIQILERPSSSALATQKAGEMLVARRDAGSLDLLAAALRTGADYTENRPEPPVEILARAIGALGPLARSMGADLAAQLRAPETSPTAATEIAHALVAIGADDAGPALRDFLTMYRGDPAYERNPAPLIAAADALLKLGAPADRTLLLFLAEEPHTASGLRAHLGRALGQSTGGDDADSDAAAAAE